MKMIRNSNMVKQAIDFEGIESGKIHPTDIDCVLEFDGKHLILIEVKRAGNDIPLGQKNVLERIATCWRGNSIVLKVEHECDEYKDIPLNQCLLTLYYYKGKWIKPKKQKLLLEVIKDLAKMWNITRMM